MNNMHPKMKQKQICNPWSVQIAPSYGKFQSSNKAFDLL